MIRIAHSSGRYGGIDLAGTPAELRGVGRRINHFLGSPAPTDAIAADLAADPTPYDRALRELVVQKGEGPTRVRVTADGAMAVEGGPAALEVFAAHFAFRDDTPSGHHCHFEYFDGDDRIDPTSVPLVIRVRRVAEGD